MLRQWAGGLQLLASQALRGKLLVHRLHTSRWLSTEVMDKCPTAALLIIGDEILKGQVKDTNSHFLCNRLFNLGVQVARISVIGDVVGDIAQEVSVLSSKYTYVITSGGIGPTHDDITYLGVAEAFGDELVHNKEMDEYMKSNFKLKKNSPVDMEAFHKMACIPSSAELVNTKLQKSKLAGFPIVRVRNVYIFPGIPKYLEHIFMQIEHFFRNPKTHFYVRELYVDRGEVQITPQLNEAVKEFQNLVAFGSYPAQNKNYGLRITMQSSSEEYVNAAHTYLTKSLPSGSVVNSNGLENNNSVGVFKLASNGFGTLGKSVRNSLQILEECFQKFTHHEICLSFNGGKDCTVLLHFLHTVLKHRYPSSTKLKVFYVQIENIFPEVESFVEECVKMYNLELIQYSGSVKQGLAQLLEEHPEIKAVVMGTRRSDPYAKDFRSFQLTDESWPRVMRIFPILDWTYEDIWDFLLQLKLPYCSLYDQGYTSIGSRNDTLPNDALRYVTDDGQLHYHPAHTLKNCSLERSGRD